MIDKIIIGTRGSQLSLIQTNIVKDLIQIALPHTTISITTITTKGDKNMSPVPLDSVGKGWFTKEIDKALIEGKIDVAVHSLKDLPERLPPDLIIVAIPEREDAREALVSKNRLTLEQLPKGAIIGTDSTRRKVQVLYRRTDLIIESIRGNVNRRLEKLETQNYDALMLAVAGLKRLGLEERITQYFAADDFIPSPGQGALAVVIKRDNLKLAQVLKKINHLPTIRVIKAERAFSSAIGGGCKMPVGAYGVYKGKSITLYGVIGSLDGKHLITASFEGDAAKPTQVGKRLAEELLEKSKEWYRK